MKRTFSFVMLVCLVITAQQSGYSQYYRISKKKVGLTAETYGLGADNFGLIGPDNKEIDDLKLIKNGMEISMAFYNIAGFEVKDEQTHLMMTMSVANTTSNELLIGSQVVLDKYIAVKDLKDDFVYGTITISTKDFKKGDAYMIKLHLWDVDSGRAIDMTWSFKANFKE